VEELRRLIIRGPEYPGAVAVEDEAGRIVQLAKLAPEKREGLAKRLLTGCPGAAPAKRGAAGGKGGAGGAAAAAAAAVAARGGAQRGWVVYRHLKDGDIMLTNRQPTLHKPGLMAHKWVAAGGDGLVGERRCLILPQR
jgi:DNA-directed RNA polymerase I subunit RPA1